MGALMRPLQLVSKPANSRRESSSSNGSIEIHNSLHNGPAINPVKVGFFNADEILEEEDEYDHSSQSRKSSQKTDEEKAENKNITLEAPQNSSNNKTKEDSNEETNGTNIVSRGFSNPFSSIRSRHLSIQESSVSPSNVNSTIATGNNRHTFMRTMLRQNSLAHGTQSSSANADLPRGSIILMDLPHI